MCAGVVRLTAYIRTKIILLRYTIEHVAYPLDIYILSQPKPLYFPFIEFKYNTAYSLQI